MRKTMYIAMKNLAEYICQNELSDFDKLWEKWSVAYNPTEEMIPSLKNMGRQLCLINSDDIKNIPELKYRKTIKQTLKPEINKGVSKSERTSSI